mgnify:CR=1 FL=1
MVNGEGNANMENVTNEAIGSTIESTATMQDTSSNENIPTPDLINYFSSHMNVLLQ